MSAPPIPCMWTGHAFEPLKRAHNIAASHYGEGEVVLMAPVEERSDLSHKHEFAWLREAWRSLPEALADDYPTAEHLRKRALIEAGYYDETVIDVGSNAAALRVAQAIRARPGETFSLVIVRGVAVVIRSAKSQSRRHMKAPEFQASKTAILEVIAAMLDVTPDTLARQAA